MSHCRGVQIEVILLQKQTSISHGVLELVGNVIHSDRCTSFPTTIRWIAEADRSVWNRNNKANRTCLTLTRPVRKSSDVTKTSGAPIEKLAYSIQPLFSLAVLQGFNNLAKKLDAGYECTEIRPSRDPNGLVDATTSNVEKAVD